MKNKGFTLVELLAVIVVLAIISIIAVPQVLITVEKARKSSAEKSMLGYVESIEIHNAKPTDDIDYVQYTNREFNVDDIKVVFKGKKPTDGTVIIDEDSLVVKASLCINNYWVEYENEEAKTLGKCSDYKT